MTTRERVERLAKVVPGLPEYDGEEWHTQSYYLSDENAADIILARLLVQQESICDRTESWRDLATNTHWRRLVGVHGNERVNIVAQGPTPLHAAIAAAEAVAQTGDGR